MKKYRFLFAAMLLAALSFGFVSCDDKTGNEPDDPSGEGTETPAPDPYNGHAYVDLGLLSGLKWATCNVGADSIHHCGDYFAWGEVEPKETYTEENYKFGNHEDFTVLTKYTVDDGHTDYSWYDSEGNFIGDNKTVLDAEDDAAVVNMGGVWRMPTHYEYMELIEGCVWKDTTINGMPGYEGKSKSNGNTIFFPLADYGGSEGIYDGRDDAYYWAKTLGNDSWGAYNFNPYEEVDIENDIYAEERYYGQSVRGVCR